ncbi:hypothetical protein CEXT_34881 [Caerostris extrusa]|uniref:Uncharacterized protein n=1 Tax=Caerostris extrusa TaxID=172846 RepID=A0AAV4MHF4_CAEEX|nr:hypothetical protein CEXT_34881 [Caerostris extrusa]
MDAAGSGRLFLRALGQEMDESLIGNGINERAFFTLARIYFEVLVTLILFRNIWFVDNILGFRTQKLDSKVLLSDAEQIHVFMSKIFRMSSIWPGDE